MSPPPPPPSSFVYVRKIEYALAKASSGEKINSTFPNFPSGVVIFLLSYPCPVRSFIPPSMAHLYYTAHHASSLSTGVLYVACCRCYCSWLVVSRLFYIQKYIFSASHPIPTTSITFSQSRRHLLPLCCCCSSTAALSFFHFHLLMLFHVRVLSFLSPSSVTSPGPHQ